MRGLRITTLLAGLIFLLIQQAWAQDNWDWSKQLECSKNAVFSALDYNSTGDLIAVVGEFNENITFFKDYSSNGGKDMLLAILDENGDSIWIKHMGGSGKDIIKDVKFDAAGNVYVTGGFSDTVNFDGTQLISYDDEDVFFAKYEPNGDLAWAKRVATGNGQDRGAYLALSGSGDVFISGFFNDSLRFESDTLKAKYGTNMFVSVFDTDGDLVIVDHVVSTSSVSRIESTDPAHDGGLLFSGVFADSMFLGSDTLVSRGSDDAFIVKVNSALETEWIRQIGGTGPDRGYGAVSDEEGNIYAIGYVSGTCEIDSTGFNTKDGAPLESAGGWDMFVAKYNSQGTLQWRGRAGDSGNDVAWGIDLDQNIINVGGYISGTVIFGKDTLESSDTSDNDIAFQVFDLDGIAVKAESIRGNGGEDQGYAMVYDGMGGQYLAGYFMSDSIMLDAITQHNTVLTKKDGVLAKYNSEFIVVASTVTDPLCYGENSGSISVTSYFGEAPYTYDWSHTDTLNSALATNLPDGSYKVVVTDNTGAKDSASVDLTEPAAMVIDRVITDVKCFGEYTGEIDITPSGGTPGVAGYTYSWGSATGIVTEDEDQDGLAAGNYTVTLMDTNDCELDSTFTIMQSPALVIDSISKGDVSVPDAGDGWAKVYASGGTPSYSYDWSNGGTTDSIGSLDGGIYSVDVTDALGCVTNDKVLIAGDDTLLVDIIALRDTITCFGAADGSVTANIIGGVRPLNWEFSRGTVVDDTIATDLGPGWIKITVTDDNAVSSWDSIYIVEPAVVQASKFNLRDISCYGLSDGGVDISVTGGITPYSYIWTDQYGDTISYDPNLVDVVAGFYSLEVTDANGCQDTETALISEPGPIDLSFDVDSVLCYGQNQGAIDMTVNGGVEPYSHLWSNTLTSEDIDFLFAGEYWVIVQDANGCSKRDTVEVKQPDELIATAFELKPACAGRVDGEVSVNVSGGTGPYTYLWDDPSGQTNQTATDLSGDNYYQATVADANGCLDTARTWLNEQGIITVTGDSTKHILCDGYLGAIYVTVNDGESPYSYLWTPTNDTIEDLMDAAAGTHDLSVEDANGCLSLPFSETIVDSSTPINIRNSAEDVACFGELTGKIILSAWESGGVPFKYSVDDGDTWQIDTNFYDLIAGSYITVVVDTVNGCDKYGDTLTVVEPSELLIVLLDPDTITGLCMGALEVTISGGTADYTYELSGDINTTQSETISGLSYTFDSICSDMLTITVTDANNCIVESTDVDFATDIINIDYIGGLTLYPNPSTGQFTIEMQNEKGEDLMLEIVNITGQVVYKKLHDYDGQAVFIRTIDLGDQAEGTYFLRVNGLPVKAKLMID